MKKLLTFVILLSIFLLSCSPHTLPTAVTAISSNSTITTSTPIIGSTPTKTQTQLSTSTEQFVIPSFVEQCVTTTTSTSSADSLKGTIIFNDWKSNSLLLQRSSILHIPEDPGEYNYIVKSFILSGGNYLGYEQENSDVSYLVIRQADGTIIKKYDKLENFIPRRYLWNSVQWQNEHTILIRSDDSKKTVKLFLIDINTDSALELSTDFPNLASGKEINWGVDDRAIRTYSTERANIVYDPSLMRVVYPKTGGIAVLYNVDKKIELASMYLQEANDPQWSPDGNFFSINAKAAGKTSELGEEFFIIGRDGSVFKRLSWLGNQYPDVSIAAYSWAPDSQHIAFWMKSKDALEYSLASLDVNSGAIINYCITGIESRNSDLALGSSGPGVLTGKPVWSPDSKKLLISKFDEAHKHFNVVLVDMSLHQSFKISQDLDPIGWLKEP